MSKKEGPRNQILDGMQERRTVILEGEVDRESTDDVGQRLIKLQMQSNERINLIIGSGGGDMEAALRLCDLITTVMIAPVRGIALGECGSSATFIMLHCQERLGTPHSRFLIHSGVLSGLALPINKATSVNLEHLLSDMRATEEMVTRLYMNRLTPAHWNIQTPEEERREFVQKLFVRGDQNFNDWMLAEEAIKVGLIEQIVYDKLDIFQN